ncbi:MAG TPA: hypothetical protein VFU43_11420 [Streptosporangiaceae bacterium]|nr:hypothetical protein [Streptosporangiaceae bacterium]
MLIAAAVCPHPPLLVPAVAGAAAPELDALRAACREAVRRLIEGPGGRAPDLLVVVGGEATTRAYAPDAAGSLRPYGVDVTVGPGEPVLPLSLTIGRWLLGQAVDPAPARVRFQGVAQAAPPRECLRLGRELAGAAERVALLVMGDGSACRAEKPGDDDLDERAEPYDAAVARALRDADADALAALDPVLSGELLVAGRAAWQVLAGATGAAGGADGHGGFHGGFTGALLADVAPYGVAYFVASWLRGRP